MNLNLFVRSMIFAVGAATLTTHALAQDIAGSSDHPVLSRFEGAAITAYQAADFDAVQLPNGPIEDESAPQAVLDLEGRVVRIAYRLDSEKTALEVVRNYEEALTGAGLTIDFACAGDQCGRRFASYVVRGGMFPRGFDRAAFNERSRALLASGQAEDINVHIFLFVMEDPSNQRTLIRQVVVEGEPMQVGAVTVSDADTLGAELERHGRTVVDGIFFETDSSEIQSESADALEQMADLLNENEALRVYIVGHTDNVGALAYNLDLSLQRASAVAAALNEDYAIGADRLDARGVANLAPLDSNISEAGRAINRRVELVVQ